MLLFFTSCFSLKQINSTPSIPNDWKTSKLENENLDPDKLFQPKNPMNLYWMGLLLSVEGLRIICYGAENDS